MVRDHHVVGMSVTIRSGDGLLGDGGGRVEGQEKTERTGASGSPTIRPTRSQDCAVAFGYQDSMRAMRSRTRHEAWAESGASGSEE